MKFSISVLVRDLKGRTFEAQINDFKLEIELNLVPRIGETIWITDSESDMIELEVSRVIYSYNPDTKTHEETHLCCVMYQSDYEFAKLQLLSYGFSLIK